MFSKITLVIPTHNRHFYLQRILDYYSAFSINIVVADSTETPFQNAIDFNCKYFHFPNTSYFVKLYSVIREINTKYIVMCADDDFIIPSSIKKCIEFLELNDDYASVQGNWIDFYTGAKIRHRPFSLLNVVGLDINNDLPSERIAQLFKNYMFLHYSVHRYENLLDTFSLLVKLSDSFGGVSQYFLDIICIINGKHKMLPIFYGARETLLYSSANTLIGFADLKGDEKYKNEYELFFDLMSTHLSKKEKIDKTVAVEIVLSYLNDYLDDVSKITELPDYLYSPLKNRKIKNWINNVPKIKILKNNYSKIIHKWIRKKRYLKNKYSKSDIKKTKNLLGFPFYDSLAKEDWLVIKRFIKKHRIR